MMMTKPKTTEIEALPELNQGEIPVMEHFYTIQGEGSYAGHAAYFIRLAGCDVGCVWCDVKSSWEVSADQKMQVDELVAEIRTKPCAIVVITGGEPTLYDLTNLTQKLRRHGYRTHIETSGAHPLTGEWDWVCLSPKKFKQPVADAYQKAHELKVVVYNRKDLNWAEDQAKHVKPDCRLLLQPEWSRRAEATPWIVAHIQANPDWQVSLQTHHYLQVP